MDGRPYSGQIRTLVTDMIDEQDRAALVAIMSNFKTGAQAKREAQSKGLVYQALDAVGRVGVLKWRGLEVALLFNRMSVLNTVLPMEKLAATPLNDTDDAWIMVNLLNVANASIDSELLRKLQGIEHQNAQYRSVIANMELEASMSIDPEVYEQVKKEADTARTRANQYFRALERTSPETAKKLKDSEPRVRTQRKDYAQISPSLRQQREAERKAQERFEAAVEAEVQKRIAKVQAKHDREKIQMLKNVSVARKVIARSLGVKSTSAKAGKRKPARRAKTQGKSKRP